MFAMVLTTITAICMETRLYNYMETRLEELKFNTPLKYEKH